ncbi:MAG: protease modulator HflC [Myxococcota bacterium]|nr:protease modulator HflC [Myxococcota bacterium]
MSKSPLIIVVVLFFLGLMAYSAAYTVQESEQVVIVQFGKVIGQPITKPGLHFKVPVFQEAKRFEKRWLEWDGDANQITTLDKRYIYIDVFARWRISEPLVFIESLRDERSAQGRLDDIIDNATRNVVANHNLIEVIRSTNRELEESDEELQLTSAAASSSPPLGPQASADEASADEAPADEATQKEGNVPSDDAQPDDAAAASNAPPRPKASIPAPSLNIHAINAANRQALYAIDVGREKLSELILEKASAKTTQLGIELKDVQFKRINYIESVQSKVFDRMITERKRVAEAFRSQGRGRSAEILGQTEKELKKIQSEAYRKSQEIMGRADAKAAAIYAAAYRQDPELYKFLKTLESYSKTIDDTSWLLLSTDADYAKYLRTMRKAQP